MSARKCFPCKPVLYWGEGGRWEISKDDIFPDDGHEVSLGPGGVHISGTGGGLRGGVGRHGQHRGRQHYCK